MLLSNVAIQLFEPKFQPGVDLMLDAIVPEYPEPFFHLPVRKMEELFLLRDRYYWVALNGDTVVGSVGVVVFENYAVLKSLFVAREFRGGDKGVANSLMQTATGKAIEQGCSEMYLGTMEQFKAAQRFYEKHGYERITEQELPGDYPHNVIDRVFFKKRI